MKTISAVIPTYNERDNIIDSYNRLKKIFVEQLSEYNLTTFGITSYSKVMIRMVSIVGFMICRSP